MIFGAPDLLPWLSWATSNPLIVSSGQKESAEPSLLSAALPEAAGSQDPQVFHNSCRISPTFPDSAAPAALPPPYTGFQGHRAMSMQPLPQ